jgi:hypothetical protein
LEVTVSFLGIHKGEPDFYIGFSEKKGEIDSSWQGEYIRKECGGWDTQWGGGGGGGLGEVYKKTIRIEPNMMLVLPIKIYSRVQS